MSSNRSWTVTAPLLPPAINHLYGATAVGKRYITADGRKAHEDFQLCVNRMRFTPDLKRSYAVRLSFTVPTWAWDIDGMIKVALDCIFGSRGDHRVVLLAVRKLVVPGMRQTGVRLRELPQPAQKRRRRIL